MNVLIMGSTGMIGKIILRECLQSEKIRRVTTIVRKPTGVTHAKLNEVVHADYLNYDAIDYHFEQLDAAYFCIGAYTGQFPDKEFKSITVDYTKAFADVIKKASPNVTICFLSGDGADQTEKSKMSFARYKGMAENYLIQMEFKHLHLFRPGYIYPVEKRTEPNLMYQTMRFLYPMLKGILAKTSITSEELGKSMFKSGLDHDAPQVLENIQIKDYLYQ
ncbi:MAG: NAD(P)H-binding protein [Cyclobacteriaceae bacterium]